jgi:hypothetical protein
MVTDVAGAGGEEVVPPPARPAPAQEPPRETFQTEFSFTLPRGYVDRHGNVQREGRMRLATARDELLPTFDDYVKKNPAYLTIILLARVVTQLGTMSGSEIDSTVMESLYAADLAFLQDLYRRVNSEGTTRAMVICPSCNEEISVDVAGGRLGES